MQSLTVGGVFAAGIVGLALGVYLGELHEKGIRYQAGPVNRAHNF